MIKSFKDFDKELKGQKIYEANMLKNKESDYYADDSLVPDLISDNKILSQITDIFLKKLNDPKNKLGLFIIRPTVIKINNIPGVYIFNQDQSINIVVCRQNIFKYVYVFKKFDVGKNNIADFVLSTKTVGFKELIDRLIDELKYNFLNNKYITEARVSSDVWKEQWGTYASYNKNDIDRFSKLSNDTRALIFTAIIELLDEGKSLNPSGIYKSILYKIPTFPSKLDEIYKDSKKVPDSIDKKLPSAFYNAYTNNTEHAKDMEVLFTGTGIKPMTKKTSKPKDELGGGSGGSTDIIKEIDVRTSSEGEKYFNDESLIKKSGEYDKLMKEIYKTAMSLCKYVKNYGSLSPTDLKNTLGHRCMVISGGTGTGKTNMVEKALKDSNMRPEVDYLDFTNGNTAPDSLYKAFYNYNGKLLIFDDTADLFRSEYKTTLWQTALNSDLNRAVLRSPDRKAYEDEDDDKKDKKGIRKYNATDLTNQQKYFLEIGNKSNALKNKFLASERPKIEERYMKIHEIEKKGDLLDRHKEDIDKLLNKAWNEHSLKIKPAMPNTFKYDGVVIIITNKNPNVLRKDKYMGAAFESIEGRARNFEVNPEGDVLWVSIKNTILRQTEEFNTGKIKNINACLIPPFLSEEFIKVVENIYATSNEHRYMTYRLIGVDVHNMFAEEFAGIPSTEESKDWWIVKIKDLMKNRKDEK